MTFNFSDRLNQFLRSLSIQGSWNFPRMQGLGFFYSLLPWLKKVSGEGFQYSSHRHLVYFNTNAYMSPYILGVVSRLEEEGRGEESIKARNNLMGPLGAMGDGFYWATLLPITVLISVALSFFNMTAAPIFFLLVYNVVHLGNRWIYLGKGYRNAHSPLEGALELSQMTAARTLENLAAPLLGLILGLAVFGTSTSSTALLVFVAAFIMYRLLWRPPAIFLMLVILGALLGILGLDMRIPWSG